MHYRETSQPAAEPVTVAQAKQQLRIDNSAEDASLQTYIVAARQMVEKMMQRSIYARNVRLTLDTFPVYDSDSSCGAGESAALAWYFRALAIRLPRPALISVTSIYYRSDDGNFVLLSPESYVTDATSEPARIMPAPGYTWPALNAYVPSQVEIDFVSGTYGDGVLIDTCPQTIKLAILLLVGHFYANREAAGEAMTAIPLGVDSLLAGENFVSCYG